MEGFLDPTSIFFLINGIFLCNFSFLRTISSSCVLVDTSVWWIYLSFILFLYFCPSGPWITFVSSQLHAQRRQWILTFFFKIIIIIFSLLLFLLLHLLLLKFAHLGCGYLLFERTKTKTYFLVHRDLGYPRLVFFLAHRGLGYLL